jgi:hypothetical protein
MKINVAAKKSPKQVPGLDMILQKNKWVGGPFLEIERRRRNCRSTKCDREKLRKGEKRPGLLLTSNTDG